MDQEGLKSSLKVLTEIKLKKTTSQPNKVEQRLKDINVDPYNGCETEQLTLEWLAKFWLHANHGKDDLKDII